jgi:L-rhamnose isomerase
MFKILMVMIFTALLLSVSMASVVAKKERSQASDAMDAAQNIGFSVNYTNAYAKNNSTVNAEVTAATIALPAWFMPQGATRYFAYAGTAYVALPVPDLGRRARILSKLTAMGARAGLKNGAGNFVSQTGVSYGPLPAAIPNDAIVVTF